MVVSTQTEDEIAREARVAYFRSIPGLIENKARDQAKADRSDPFTYARVRAHFLNGTVVEPDDYSVEWGRELCTSVFGARRVEFAVTVPRNVKRP